MTIDKKKIKINKKKIKSWSNVSVEDLGKIGFFGHSIEQLEQAIDRGWFDKVEKVQLEKSTQTNSVFFAEITHQYYGLFLPVTALTQKQCDKLESKG